jgi:hypothetical protein
VLTGGRAGSGSTRPNPHSSGRAIWAWCVAKDVDPRPGLANVRQTGCNQASFYRDADAASGWLAANPHGRLVAMADAFEVLRTSMLRIEEWFEQPVG